MAVISTLPIVASQNETQAAPASFTIPEATPTPTPTPTPTATPTPAPTFTPRPTTSPDGEGGSSAGSQPSISMILTIDIFGHETQWLRNSAGKILEDVYALSEDGRIALEIPGGTYALDADGEPLTEISLILTDPLMKAPDSTIPDDDYLLGTYEFWPYGATFSQPINIIIFYDPSELPKAPDELTFKMYSLDNEMYEWDEIPFISNIDDNTVVFSIDYLRTFALTAVPRDTANSPGSPIPDISESHNNWLLLILILPAALLAFFIFALIRRRRRNSTTAEPQP
ncbi:MAG: hypothetical protein WC455_00620 [Dehalococcoidia bacterium]